MTANYWDTYNLERIEQLWKDHPCYGCIHLVNRTKKNVGRPYVKCCTAMCKGVSVMNMTYCGQHPCQDKYYEKED